MKGKSRSKLIFTINYFPFSICRVLTLVFFFTIFLLSPLIHAEETLSSIPAESRTILGNETFCCDLPETLLDKRLGLVINHTSLLPDGTPLLAACLKKGMQIKAIFSPEHGYSGNIEGGNKVKDNRLNDIKIFSLYGKTRRPTPEQMREIDAFIYDIQDVGTRFYTYITTLKYVLEAAAKAKMPVYVLDRPNPAGGIIIEGPLLQPEFESYIGSIPVPVRYGLTIGELALMMKGQGWVPTDVKLHVIKMKNWKRNYFWEDTGLTWIPTSPNIPSPETAVIYPGTGLLGGIILNQGLGTPDPFLQFGSPWMDPALIIRKLPSRASQGVKFEIIDYTPRPIPGKTLDPPYKNQICHGISVRITQKNKFYPLRFTLALIKLLKENYPDKIFKESNSLSLMFGNSLLAEYLRGETSYKKLLASIKKDEDLFRKIRHKYLLYE